MGIKSLLNKLFRKKIIKDDHFLALDIGTEFVKALIVKIESQNKSGIVLAYGIIRQKPNNMLAGAVADIEGVIESCRLAVEQAQNVCGIVCSQVVVGIAGEFVSGVTSAFSETRDSPKSKIDSAELKRLVQKIQWRAFNKIRQDFARESGISEIEVKLINAAIVDVKIDGYRVTNPIGFQGKNISLGIFNAYAPLLHLGALQSIIKSLRLDLLFVAAEPYAIARFGMKNDAIFIDIGGGTTDIALVREGGIEGIRSLALGGRAFTKRIAQLLNLDFSQAEDIKIKYSQRDVSPQIQRKITSIFKKDIEVLARGIGLALEEISGSSPLPWNILLCGGGSALPGIKKILSENAWRVGLPFTREPIIEHLKPAELSGIVDQTGQLKEPKDVTPLALAGLIIELLRADESPLGLIIKRSVRLLQS